jgi:two-component system, sensor histidine kinase and response regulator
LSNSLIRYWRRLPEDTRGYVVAFAAVTAAALAGLALRQYLDRSIFIMFAAPIAITAWYGGSGPALAATLLGIVAADLVFIERASGAFLPRSPDDLVAIGVYALVGLTIVYLSMLLRSARDDARLNAQLLQDQAMELELQTAELEQQTQEAQTLSEELEEAHEALKLKSQSQLAEAQSLARLGSWEWDIAANSITWSDEMYRLYGLEPSDGPIDYARYQSLMHPDDRASTDEAVRHSLATGIPFTYDHRVVREDGQERIFSARGKVIQDGAGRAIGMIGTGQDVTETRRAAAALQTAAEYAARQTTAEAATRHLNRVFAQAPVVIAVLGGPDHRFELINEKGVELVGDRILVGRTVAEALPELGAQGFFQLLDVVFEHNQPFIGKEIFARLGPETEGGFFNFVFQPLSDETGVYALLVVATDVSDLVRSRLAAEDAQREALAASRAKSDFLARMSHELRTPLAAIIGYGELLFDGITGPVNEEQKRQLARIRSSANHLLAIIDEILTLARMEAGKEKVEMVDVDLDDLMDSVASMAEPLASAKGLAFNLDGSTPGLTMRTDPMKLRQVLLNLISNAVKYTDTGSVAVATKSDDGMVHFLVSDTGVGVEDEHHEKIFEPFWQVEHTMTRRAGGTGLGLAVTRQFVDLLGGRISVESCLGKGSTFRVSLPKSPKTE